MPAKTTRSNTPADHERLRVLQDTLDSIVGEARVLRDRLELLMAAQQMAIGELRLARRQHRRQLFSRANRVF